MLMQSKEARTPKATKGARTRAHDEQILLLREHIDDPDLARFHRELPDHIPRGGREGREFHNRLSSCDRASRRSRRVQVTRRSVPGKG